MADTVSAQTYVTIIEQANGTHEPELRAYQ